MFALGFIREVILGVSLGLLVDLIVKDNCTSNIEVGKKGN